MIVPRVRVLNILLPLIIAICFGCNGIHEIKLPSIQFHNFQKPKIETRWSNFNIQSMELSLGLVFKFDNPTPMPLIFPSHQFSFIFDGNQSMTIGASQNGFSVPPNQAKLITYPIECNLVRNGPFSNILGRDVPYKFEARFQLSSNSDPIILAYENSVRLPLLPTVTVDTQQTPTLRVLGSIKEINISAQVDVMDDFVNLLIDIGNPFIDFLSTVSHDARHNWDNFKKGWDQFSTQPNSLVDPLNSTITGLKFQIPLIVRNPNRFPINAPTMKFDIGLAGRIPTTSFQTVYRYGNPEIPAKVRSRDGFRKLTLEGQINWNAMGAGLQPLIDTSTLTVLIKSEMNIDLGYGPTDLNFEIRQVPFRFGR